MINLPIRPALLRPVAGILAAAVLAAMYARGGPACLLGFVLLVPWLYALDGSRTLRATLASAYGMTLAYTLAVFPWLGAALGRYAGIGEEAALATLLLVAPLFQPQFLVFALVRRLSARWYGPGVQALAASCAWVAAERLLPRLLDDTLGYGLYPSAVLRQAAEVGGGALLTLLLLLSNAGVAALLQRWRRGWRALLVPLALSAAIPALLAGFGVLALSGGAAPEAKPLRVGMVQANIVDYERLRQQQGAFAVVNAVLERHFAMSYDAVVHQGAQAVLWSETVYPTTFGAARSEAGAEFDRAIVDTVNAAKVPFVFGTYDRDAGGEYNAAAFVEPGAGLLGFYRKTRLFPLTEYVPAWLDGPLLRQLLPWAGNWRAGNGARVFPLRLADGREIPVLPLICLDDVDASLAIQGARLGAQAILTMSNDSWFSSHPQGARLHQMVAAFRSIETRLPQFRVTTTGYSAAIDANGAILAATRMGEPAIAVADVVLHQPAPTLMVRWGDWVGLASLALLALLALKPALPALQGVAPDIAAAPRITFPVPVLVMPRAVRLLAALLRVFARLALLGVGIVLLSDEALRNNTLAQLRSVAAFVLLPEFAAWCLLRAFAARATVMDGQLVLARGAQRISLALDKVAGVTPWRFAAPRAGVGITLADGKPWRYGLAVANPGGFAQAIAEAGGPAIPAPSGSAMDVYAQGRLALRRLRIDHPLVKFAALPLLLAIPAFHLHQHIAFGSALGEYYSFGLKAYLGAFAIWWGAWAVGVALSAALVRAAIEAGAMLAALVRPRQAVGVRVGLERAGHYLLYLGLPAWLMLRIFAA